jgi:hypothetical protein
MSTPATSTNRRENILSLASQIENLDQEMQTALESGSLTTARELAERQEKLLSMLMLNQQRR